MPFSLWKALPISPVSLLVVRSAHADSLDTAGKQIYAGTVAGAAVAAGVVLIVLHERMTLTGKRHGRVFESRSVLNDMGVCQAHA